MEPSGLQALLWDWRLLLRRWAASGALSAAARDALQLTGDPPQLRALTAAWSAGSFEALPPVELLPSAAMGAAAGAYAAARGTIYLNPTWLQNASQAQAIAVLNEELGHHLDALINPRDTSGDEGELFAALLATPGGISAERRSALRLQNDQAVLQLADQTLAVEEAVVESHTPLISLTLLPASVLEDGPINLVYFFRRSGSTTAPLTVSYSVGGTASYLTDFSQRGAASFNASSGSITFAAGASTARLTIDPTADSSVEGDETLALTLTPGSDYIATASSAVTGSIGNDDALIFISVSPASVLEDGLTNLIYTVSRIGYTAAPLTVRFAVSGTATYLRDFSQRGASSFSASSGSIAFAAGATTARLTIDPTADSSVESDESVALTLTPGNGYTIAASRAVTGTINNDDSTVSLAVSPTSVLEDSPTNLTYTFSRSGYTAAALTVAYSVGGSAGFSSDYTVSGASAFAATSGSIVFAAGATTATLTIDPSADSSVEANETVLISLLAGNGYTSASSSAVIGTISNDDTQPQTPPPGAITASSLISGTIAMAGEVDTYGLDTITGAIISVSVNSGSNTLWPLIDLVDPSGTLLQWAGPLDGTGSPKSAGSYNSTAADLGLYDLSSGKAAIRVKTQAGFTGDYSLNVGVTSRRELKDEVIRLTNIERQKEGLTPLTYNALLEQAADGHVQDMDAHDQYLAHTGSNGSDPVTRIKATGYKGAYVNLGNGSLRTIPSENAAAGQKTPAEVVTAWMNSPGHRAAIMDPGAREIGVGVEYDNEAGRMYWIQDFGNPWSPGLVQWF